MEADLSSKSNYLTAQEQLTGRREERGESGALRAGGSYHYLNTSSCNDHDHLQQNICLLNEMQRTGDPRLIREGEFYETPPMAGPLKEKSPGWKNQKRKP